MPTGTDDGAAGVDRLHAAHHAVGRQHADAAHAVLAEVLLHLGDDVDGDAAARAVVLDAHGVVDGGHLVVELDVHDGPDDLHDATDVLRCHVSFLAIVRRGSAAPPVLTCSVLRATTPPPTPLR